MVDDYVQYAVHSEVKLTAKVQEIFNPVDSWVVVLSEYFSPASLIDHVIPLIGSTDMLLMSEMTFTVCLLNVISSVIKWTFPQHRAYWWIREYDQKSIVIKQSPLTCETTAGFPSAHSMAFTGLMYVILIYYFKLSPCTRWLVVSLMSIPMWITRVYFGSQFLHQCICGSIVAVFVIDTIRHRRQRSAECAGVIFMESWRKTISIAAVTTVGLFVIGMYFVMLYAGLDPHWSVRMAFKWCTDPQYLRHETSPIFTICRDLGCMMGIALSSPLTERLKQRLNPRKSIPAVVVIMAIGYFLRKRTPKNHGRLAFVAYEFLRNAMHTFALLSIYKIS